MGNYRMLHGNGDSRYMKVTPKVSITFLTSRSKVLRLSFLLKFPQHSQQVGNFGKYLF